MVCAAAHRHNTHAFPRRVGWIPLELKAQWLHCSVPQRPALGDTCTQVSDQLGKPALTLVWKRTGWWWWDQKPGEEPDSPYQCSHPQHPPRSSGNGGNSRITQHCCPLYPEHHCPQSVPWCDPNRSPPVTDTDFGNLLLPLHMKNSSFSFCILDYYTATQHLRLPCKINGNVVHRQLQPTALPEQKNLIIVGYYLEIFVHS